MCVALPRSFLVKKAMIVFVTLGKTEYCMFPILKELTGLQMLRKVENAIKFYDLQA
jgi:hypothetical protein